MPKLLTTACAALFLLSAIVSIPLGPQKRRATMKEIITKVQALKQLPENTPFVPKVPTVSEATNLSIEEIACRGVESLKNLCSPWKEQFASLNYSLEILSQGVNCTENNEESQDLQLFVDELLRIFQNHYVKLSA